MLNLNVNESTFDSNLLGSDSKSLAFLSINGGINNSVVLSVSRVVFDLEVQKSTPSEKSYYTVPVITEVSISKDQAKVDQWNLNLGDPLNNGNSSVDNWTLEFISYLTTSVSPEHTLAEAFVTGLELLDTYCFTVDKGVGSLYRSTNVNSTKVNLKENNFVTEIVPVIEFDPKTLSEVKRLFHTYGSEIETFIANLTQTAAVDTLKVANDRYKLSLSVDYSSVKSTRDRMILLTVFQQAITFGYPIRSPQYYEFRINIIGIMPDSIMNLLSDNYLKLWSKWISILDLDKVSYMNIVHRYVVLLFLLSDLNFEDNLSGKAVEDTNSVKSILNYKNNTCNVMSMYSPFKYGNIINWDTKSGSMNLQPISDFKTPGVQDTMDKVKRVIHDNKIKTYLGAIVDLINYPNIHSLVFDYLRTTLKDYESFNLSLLDSLFKSSFSDYEKRFPNLFKVYSVDYKLVWNERTSRFNVPKGWKLPEGLLKWEMANSVVVKEIISLIDILESFAETYLDAGGNVQSGREPITVDFKGIMDKDFVKKQFQKKKKTSNYPFQSFKKEIFSKVGKTKTVDLNLLKQFTDESVDKSVFYSSDFYELISNEEFEIFQKIWNYLSNLDEKSFLYLKHVGLGDYDNLNLFGISDVYCLYIVSYNKLYKYHRLQQKQYDVNSNSVESLKFRMIKAQPKLIYMTYKKIISFIDSTTEFIGTANTGFAGEDVKRSLNFYNLFTNDSKLYNPANSNDYSKVKEVFGVNPSFSNNVPGWSTDGLTVWTGDKNQFDTTVTNGDFLLETVIHTLLFKLLYKSDLQTLKFLHLYNDFCLQQMNSNVLIDRFDSNTIIITPTFLGSGLSKTTSGAVIFNGLATMSFVHLTNDVDEFPGFVSNEVYKSKMQSLITSVLGYNTKDSELFKLLYEKYCYNAKPYIAIGDDDQSYAVRSVGDHLSNFDGEDKSKIFILSDKLDNSYKDLIQQNNTINVLQMNSSSNDIVKYFIYLFLSYFWLVYFVKESDIESWLSSVVERDVLEFQQLITDYKNEIIKRIKDLRSDKLNSQSSVFFDASKRLFSSSDNNLKECYSDIYGLVSKIIKVKFPNVVINVNDFNLDLKYIEFVSKYAKWLNINEVEISEEKRTNFNSKNYTSSFDVLLAYLTVNPFNDFRGYMKVISPEMVKTTSLNKEIALLQLVTRTNLAGLTKIEPTLNSDMLYFIEYIVQKAFGLAGLYSGATLSDSEMVHVLKEFTPILQFDVSALLEVDDLISLVPYNLKGLFDIESSDSNVVMRYFENYGGDKFKNGILMFLFKFLNWSGLAT